MEAQNNPSLHPPSQCRAVIDIGTNSVKLLVADIHGSDIIPREERSKQTRLGRGFYQTKILQSESIAATAKAVRKFAERAINFGARNIRIIATSAARDAKNANDLLNALREAVSLPVEIISGEQEADWVFRGVLTDSRLAGKALLILDVGGGSTEFILGEGTQQTFRQSYPMGTVRLLESIRLPDPPGAESLANCRERLKQFLDTEIAPMLNSALQQCKSAVQLIGTGGTVSILARMEKQLPEFDRKEIESTRLSLAQISKQVERLWSLSLEERRQIIGLPPKRADVILTGAVIYEAVTARFAFSELLISTRGLRYAAVMASSP